MASCSADGFDPISKEDLRNIFKSSHSAKWSCVSVTTAGTVVDLTRALVGYFYKYLGINRTHR